jgi:hypothetical protein
MRIRKAVITVTLAAAAIGATAATPALAATAAHTPSVGHNVGGGLLTTRALHVGQVIDLVGSNRGRISNYRVTAEHRDAGVYYVTVWPRLQSGGGNLVLFTTSN